MNIRGYRNFTAEPFSFLVIATFFTSDNVLCFQKNLLEGMKRVVMTIDENLRDEKLQYPTITEQ